MPDHRHDAAGAPRAHDLPAWGRMASTLLLSLGAWAVVSPALAPGPALATYPALDDPDAEVRFEVPQKPVRTVGELFELMDQAARDGSTVVLTVK